MPGHEEAAPRHVASFCPELFFIFSLLLSSLFPYPAHPRTQTPSPQHTFDEVQSLVRSISFSVLYLPLLCTGFHVLVLLSPFGALCCVAVNRTITVAAAAARVSSLPCCFLDFAGKTEEGSFMLQPACVHPLCAETAEVERARAGREPGSGGGGPNAKHGRTRI